MPLTPRAEDFPRWYQDVVAGAELAEGGPVRGTMVIRPWGYAIWELLQAELDRRIKACGVENAYFPLFIPEEFLRLEAEHVEGFSPELAVVGHAGGKDLEEPVVVRPTSETVINHFFAKWVQSYRDLPMLINQWANVVRWELRPRLFLRTTEFLWQEGHTVHVDEEDARRFALRILDEVYRETMNEIMAVPVLLGLKTDRERFAGADRTWTCEGMMGDGKALQMGTSHELGQNFAKVFGIEFSGVDGARHLGWQTSWGVSTRLIGALIMVHGDDAGLRLPPSLAPVQVVVMVVKEDAEVAEVADRIAAELTGRGMRVRLDARTGTSFGRRAVEWELKGVPLRLEIGPRDLAAGNVTLAVRHTRTKETFPIEKVVDVAVDRMSRIGNELHAEAADFRRTRTTDVGSLEEAVEQASEGFVRIPWNMLAEGGEDRLAAEGLSVRCLQDEDGGLPEGVRDTVAVVAKAY